MIRKHLFAVPQIYRAILNTILDWIILLKEHKSLSSSPFQFGFKKGLSIRNALIACLTLYIIIITINMMYLF